MNVLRQHYILMVWIMTIFVLEKHKTTTEKILSVTKLKYCISHSQIILFSNTDTERLPAR